MSIRDEKQEDFVRRWIKYRFGILDLCPRFGKIKVAINILRNYKDDARVLIAYPDKKIKQSWLDDFEKWGYSNPNVIYTTHLSLHKHVEELFDLVIIDEIHLLSERQIAVCKDLFIDNKHVLGLTGTLSPWTENTLERELDLSVIGTYSIETAIRDGVLPEYEINVVTVPLDDVYNKYLNSSGRWRTEKQRFADYQWLVDREDKNEAPNLFLRLKMIRLLQESIAKTKKTADLIYKFREERLLVFCGRIDIADSLDIPSYHSKSKDKTTFRRFVKGEIPHIAVVKIGNTGVTYVPLNKVIINYFDSNSENLTQKINRCMSLEYDNPEKKAVIYIVTSDEKMELKWLRKALEMFDNNKIKYL